VGILFGHLSLELLTTLRGAMTLLLNPSRADATPDIEDGLIRLKATQKAVEYVMAKPGVSEIVAERYLAPPPDLKALAEYPSGSLGYEFAAYLKETGFDPNYYRALPITDDTSYVLTRLRQTHDLWHLVTGFGSDVNGELGLQAFCLAQVRLPLPIILLAGGLLKTLVTAPDEMESLLDRIAVGYRLGSKAKPMLAQRWEMHWEKPLAQWRTELGLDKTASEHYVP
jgi:ubiquinone biosynthesis protein COQ4